MSMLSFQRQFHQMQCELGVVDTGCCGGPAESCFGVKVAVGVDVDDVTLSCGVYTHVDAAVVAALQGVEGAHRDFDAPGFEEITTGAGTADRLEAVMAMRDARQVPVDRIVDSRYQDLMDDPEAAIRSLYHALEIPDDDDVGARVRQYLDHKPKHKHGVHRYKGLPPEELARVRPLFER